MIPSAIIVNCTVELHHPKMKHMLIMTLMTLSGSTFGRKNKLEEDIQNGHCYADCIVPLNCTDVYCPPRVLMGSNILEDKDLTLEKCKDFCFGRNYKFAGVEEDNCYCGNEIWPLIEKPSSECDVRCSGDKSQVCGGKCRVNVYQNVWCSTLDLMSWNIVINPSFINIPIFDKIHKIYLKVNVQR